MPGLTLGFSILLAGGHSARALELDLRTTCHGVGDGKADDGPALRTCLDYAQRSAAQGVPAVLRIPAGVYRITAATGDMPVLNRGVTILGEGPHSTTLVLDAGFRGDLFAWDEAWVGRSASGDRIAFSADASGPTIQGLRITGVQHAPVRQNAMVFYDRDDHVLIRDVEVAFLSGACLSIGQTRRAPIAYMRESTIENLKCFSSGAPDAAAVTFSSTAHPGTDGTNQIDVYKLAVFDAPGQGVAIRNPGVGSATRAIRFYSLRVEKTGREALAIGDPADHGQVAGLKFFSFTSVNAGGAAIRIAAATDGKQPYDIRIEGGTLGPGNARGIEIDSGRLINIDLDNIDAPVVLGPQAGTDISFSGNGAQSRWQFSGTKPVGAEAMPLELRSPFTLRGLPGAGDQVGAAALKATLQGGETERLTMDGAAPSAYNCFNPSYAQGFALGLRVLLQDTTQPARFYSWYLPSAVFSAWTGAGAARLDGGVPEILSRGAEGASVSVAADRKAGCLAVLAHAPEPVADRWAATARIDYVRAP